jgi:hypothetical protein
VNSHFATMFFFYGLGLLNGGSITAMWIGLMFILCGLVFTMLMLKEINEREARKALAKIKS